MTHNYHLNYNADEFTETIKQMLENYQLRTSLLNYIAFILELDDITVYDIEYLVTYWNEYLYDITSNYITDRNYQNLDKIVLSALLHNRD